MSRCCRRSIRSRGPADFKLIPRRLSGLFCTSIFRGRRGRRWSPQCFPNQNHSEKPRRIRSPAASCMHMCICAYVCSMCASVCMFFTRPTLIDAMILVLLNKYAALTTQHCVNMYYADLGLPKVLAEGVQLTEDCIFEHRLKALRVHGDCSCVFVYWSCTCSGIVCFLCMNLNVYYLVAYLCMYACMTKHMYMLGTFCVCVLRTRNRMGMHTKCVTIGYDLPCLFE
jgi:hypothetical protein